MHIKDMFSTKNKSHQFRNTYSSKKVKTSFDESEIQVPQDKEASFNKIIGTKSQIKIDGLENVIVSLYAKGKNLSDVEEQIRRVYNFDVSNSIL